MLFSFANYMGAPNDWARWFDLLCGLFFGGVVTYGCQPFYLKAGVALKEKVPSIDLPIALSVLVGAGISYWHLYTGQGDVYFDSLAVLAFLILTSRYVLSLYQKNLLSPSYFKQYFHIETATKIDSSGKEKRCSPEELKKGDHVRVKRDEVFPVDGVLTSQSVWVDSSVLTGEFLPAKVKSGSLCFAGTQCLSESADVTVTKNSRESRIGCLISQVERQILKRTPLTSLADKVSQYFTISVLALGSCFFLYYINTDFNEALNRSLALVILACPCALAFATPLGQSITLAKLAKAGILVKNGNAIEKLSKIKRVVFDKTGTLSEGKLQFLGWGERLPTSQEKSLIYALEESSTHPVGRSLKAVVKDFCDEKIVLNNWRELTGQGVFGTYKGKDYLGNHLCSSG